MSLNKVMLIGNVGKEPEVRYLDNGVAVASVVLATSERGYRLQNGTEVPERTEWHSVVIWGRQAEAVEQYVHKGDKLFIEGRISTRTYDDRNGVKHRITEIFADKVEFMSPRSAASAVQSQAQPSPSANASAMAASAAGTAEGLPF